MSTRSLPIALILLLQGVLVPAAVAQVPLGPSFTYQGRLDNNAAPLNGTADLRFTLWDGATSPPGVQIGAIQTVSNVTITDGLFTVSLNAASEFGAAPFDGQARWLQIAVRSPAGGGVFTTLAPRQALAAAPYASFSAAPWRSSGGNLSYTGGNVGIGTAFPQTLLSISQGGDFNTFLSIDSGLTAPQYSAVRFYDRGFPIWSLGKIGSNDFSIREIANSTDRLSILQGGNVGIGTSSPDVKLQIQGGTDASPAGGGYLAIGSTTSTNIVIDNNEIMARNNGATSTLFLNNDGGDVVIAPGFTTRVGVLEITGGSDLSERFDVGGGGAVPGTVVVIDPEHPGELTPATQAYDRKVAGVISGAGGVKPGMLMSQTGTAADGKHPVALTGRVYCLADAGADGIRPGDFLTTSNIRGHAMKAADPARAQGAVLGKAMTPLAAGQRGLVLVLVTLQ
jgi:hypothetical protein